MLNQTGGRRFHAVPGKSGAPAALAAAMLMFATGCGAMSAESGASSVQRLTGAEIAGQAVASPAARVVDNCWSEPPEMVPVPDGKEGQTMPQYKTAPAMKIDPAKTYTATLKTNKGDITIEFFPKDAPATVNNFICLAEDGYYNNTPFHRIIKGFMIQGGDPTGTGRGGPGYQFKDEPVKRPYNRGIVAMANAGPNTNGSQFFIMHADYPLPPNYTIFGQVTKGMDVVDAIANTPATGPEGSTPTEPLVVESVTVSDN